MDFDKVIQAWKKASTDLQIIVEAPFLIKTHKEEIEFPMLIHDFGREKGTIILDIDDFRNLFDIPGQYGFYCSCLGPAYAKYDREEFIDTLEDWGYFGVNQNKPFWYEGKYYKEEEKKRQLIE